MKLSTSFVTLTGNMLQIKLFVALLIALTKASTLANNVDVEKDEISIETMKRYKNDPKREMLSWRLENDNNDILNALGYTSDQHGDSNNHGNHAWLRYRSDSDKAPSNSKIVKIFNTRGFLAVNKLGKVYATGSKDDPEVQFKALVYSFGTKTYRVRLLNVKRARFIAISCNTGKVYSTPNRQNPETILLYTPNGASGDTFQSEKCSQSYKYWYLGITKKGQIKNARVASAKDKGTRFLLF